MSNLHISDQRYCWNTAKVGAKHQSINQSYLRWRPDWHGVRSCHYIPALPDRMLHVLWWTFWNS